MDDLISRTELLQTLETWDRFGVDDTNSLFRLDNLSLPHYVAYIHYDDVVKCIKGMPSVKADGDYISRQAVIDSIDKWVKNMGVLIALPAQEVTPLFDSIHGLPTVAIPSADKWIPVSERLPEDEEDVLFCDLFGHIMLGYHPRDWKSTHFAERGSWELQKNVAAWMPLPSPYSTDGMASDKLTTDDSEPDGTGGQIFCP